MKKIITMLFVLSIISVKAFAGVTINREFTVEVGMEEEATLCKVIFKPKDNKLVANSGDSGCIVSGDIEEGFSITLKPNTKHANGEDEANK